MAIQKELDLKPTNKMPSKPKAPTKKELVRALETLDADFVNTDINRVRLSTLNLIIEKLS